MSKDIQSALAAAVEEVRRQADELQAEIERLEAQRATIASAPPARDDVHAAVDQWIVQAGERYRRPLREALKAMLEQPLMIESILTDSSRPWLSRPLGLATAANEKPLESAVASGAMALFLGTLVSEGLKAEADNLMKGQPEGLPIAERRLALVKIDAEITTRQKALAELRHGASAAGVNFQ